MVYSPAREIQAGNIGVNAVQRKFFRFQLLQKVGAKVYEAPATIALTSLTAQIDLQIKVSGLLFFLYLKEQITTALDCL